MAQRTYDGPAIDGVMKHISEKDLDDASERLDAPGEEHSDGDVQTTESLSSNLTKGQKIAKLCAETGVTNSSELYEEIQENRGFEVSYSHVSNVLNKNFEIEGFTLTEDGEPEFEEPVDETRQEVLRIGRLNQNESYRTIYNKCRQQGLDVTYNYVWEVVSENTPKEKRRQDGTKKRAIIRAFNDTKKTGSDLIQEVRSRGYDVSEAMVRKTIPEIDGYWDAKPKTKKEKIREVADRVEYDSSRELAEHINQNEDFEVIRHYVSEVLNEVESENDDCRDSNANSMDVNSLKIVKAEHPDLDESQVVVGPDFDINEDIVTDVVESETGEKPEKIEYAEVPADEVGELVEKQFEEE